GHHAFRDSLVRRNHARRHKIMWRRRLGFYGNQRSTPVFHNGFGRRLRLFLDYRRRSSRLDARLDGWSGRRRRGYSNRRWYDGRSDGWFRRNMRLSSHAKRRYRHRRGNRRSRRRRQAGHVGLGRSHASRLQRSCQQPREQFQHRGQRGRGRLRPQHRRQHIGVPRAAAGRHEILDCLAQLFRGVLDERKVIPHGPRYGLFERGGFFSAWGLVHREIRSPDYWNPFARLSTREEWQVSAKAWKAVGSLPAGRGPAAPYWSIG